MLLTSFLMRSNRSRKKRRTPFGKLTSGGKNTTTPIPAEIGGCRKITIFASTALWGGLRGRQSKSLPGPEALGDTVRFSFRFCMRNLEAYLFLWYPWGHSCFVYSGVNLKPQTTEIVCLALLSLAKRIYRDIKWLPASAGEPSPAKDRKRFWPHFQPQSGAEHMEVRDLKSARRQSE